MKKLMGVIALIALIMVFALSGCGGGGTPISYEFSVDSNTIALWHFNDTTGATSITDSCNHYPLTLYPATDLPTFITRDANFNNCFSLDSTKQQYAWSANYTTQKSYGTQLTIEFWMKFSTSQSCQIIMDVDPAIYLYKDSANKLHTQLYDASTGSGGSWNGLLDSTTVLSTNVWHYIAWTYDGTNENLYIDGVLDCHMACKFIPYTNPSRGWWIGTNGTSPTSWYFNGQFDEMRILTVARTAQQIHDYYAHATQP